ncbi:hypothetical protein [Streptomyces sp. 8N706]|uniref:hypothetical protein n=1 Tax=Streptomyces sp. 8N706 TaxID=3457416 RepID=UPI003FD54125
MTFDTPLSQRPVRHLSDVRRRVLTLRQLRARGATAADVADRIQPGGGWQQLLPGVYLLHQSTPTSEERLHAALLYAGRPTPSRRPGVPPSGDGPDGEAMITGLAALALHRFASAPPLRSLARIEVLISRTRRLRSTGPVRLVRTHALPQPVEITGLPVAPVPRALADAVAQLADASAVRRLLTEAVRGGHCEPAPVVRELSRLRLLSRPHVVDAVDTLLAEGRALTEGRLYEMVRTHALPDPLWNVDLRLPGGPHLGGVDAYWPDHSVALEIDVRTPRHDENAAWSEAARKREHLERLGITVVHTTPRKLREAMEQQATVVRTALTAAGDRDPAAYVVVTPR